MKRIFSVVLFCFVLPFTNIVQSQTKSGMMSIGAAVAIPTGLSASLVSTDGNGGNGTPLGQLNITVTGGTNFSYVLNSSMELICGIGVFLSSYSVPTGTAPDSKTTLGIAVGGRMYLRENARVAPFLSAEIGYMVPPRIKTSETNGVDFSLLTVSAGFGVQAFITDNIAFSTQLGIGYSSGSASVKSSTATNTYSTNGIQLGGGTIGVRIYWN
jgi:hypothetical protein